MSRIIEELKRRQVLKPTGIYIVFAWVLLQVADVVVPAAGWPEWVITFVLYLMILGFPFVLLLSWMFDLTSKGVEREDSSSKKSFSLDSPIILVSLLVFFGGAYFAYQKALPLPDLTPSIAVIPFENLTGDENQDFLSNGITEEIMNNLFRMQNLKVISRISVYAVKDLNLELPEIGSRLGVENVLEGNLQINGDNLRLAVRMIEVATGKRLWSETFDGELSDFEFQDLITNTVIEKVSGIFGRQAPALKPVATREVMAREHYLRGLYYFENRGEENMQHAADLFRQAIDVDPLYADAWAALGQALFMGGSNDSGVIEAENRRVDAAIERALKYDPENPRALTVKASIAAFRDWDLKTAVAISQRAVSLAPGSGDARHFHAILLGLSGRPESALPHQRLAASLNPLYPPLLEGIGNLLRHLWRFEECAETYEQSIRNGFDRVYGSLYFCYGNLGQIEEAAHAIMQHNDPHVLDKQDHMFLAYFSGDQEEATRIYKEHFLNRRPPASDGNFKALEEAAIAGDLDYFFESLMAAAEMKDFNLVRFMRSKRVEEVYADPRWVEFINHPNMKPIYDLYIEAGEVAWLPIMNAAIAERENLN
jgi:TolB-like protein/Tfp pilus assembly protein PilF